MPNFCLEKGVHFNHDGYDDVSLGIITVEPILTQPVDIYQGNAIPVHRFWSFFYGSHHYTISAWEKHFIIANWPDYWHYEGPAFQAYVSQYTGSVPVYRFWSDVYRSHHYTISEWEKDYIIATWPEYWTYEKIAFYAYPQQ